MAKSQLSTFSPQMRHTIDQRWQEWEPWMSMKCRKESDRPDLALARIKEIYLERVHILLQQSLRWPVIRRNNLDNPIVSDDDFRRHMADAQSRSNLRRGWNRSKGSKKVISSESKGQSQ